VGPLASDTHTTTAPPHYCITHRQYKIGPEKGALFEDVLQQRQTTWALEVGTFLGYSAIRTARHLQPGGQLLCIEANPDNAAVAREVVRYAGLGQQVQVINGLSGQVIPKLPALLAAAQQQQQQQQSQQQQSQQQQAWFDFVFLDHSKADYLPDLQSLERLGLVRRGTTVVADNVVYPSAPGELPGWCAVKESAVFQMTGGLPEQTHSYSQGCVAEAVELMRQTPTPPAVYCTHCTAGFLEYLDSSGRYNTQLLKARYEYEQAWNPDWEPNKEDAMSVSVCSSDSSPSGS
jgi:predicted O-methyltransferase YrrM